MVSASSGMIGYAGVSEMETTQSKKMKRRKLARLQTLATTLNYRLVPCQ